MKLNDDRKPQFLQACDELIKVLYLKYKNDYPQINVSGEVPYLQAGKDKIYLSPAEFPNLAHDKLTALIKLYNKVASAGDEEVSVLEEAQELGLLMQHSAMCDAPLHAFFHEFSDVLSLDERIQIRTGMAVHDLLAILQDESELEKALACTGWFSESFRTYAHKTGYVQAFAKPLTEFDITDDFTRGVLPGLNGAFPNELEKLDALTWNESMKLYSVMAYLESKYLQEDQRIDLSSLVTEEYDEAEHQRLSSSYKLILTNKPSVLNGHLGEIIPRLQPARKDKEEDASSVNSNVAAIGESQSKQFYYYVDRHTEFVANIENNVTAFKRDFIANHSLNGVKHLGFVDEKTEQIDEISDEELIAQTRQILGAKESISDKQLVHFMWAYEQVTYQRYITSIRAHIDAGLEFISLDLPAADRFETEIAADGTIYLNYLLENAAINITAPSLDGNADKRILATLPADIRLRFKLSSRDGQPGFELIEKSTTNRDILNCWQGQDVPLDALVKKYNKKAYEEQELAKRKQVKPKLESYEEYMQELSRVINDRQYSEPVRDAARDVLNAVIRQSQHSWPRVSRQELTEVLESTIAMVKTPAVIDNGSGEMIANQLFNQIATDYEQRARRFKNSATKKIIGGVMLALLSVAVIVGCALLIASTHGAAIGIPMLVAPALAPHFTAGMGLSIFAGGCLGFFGIKAFSRAASDLKLSKSMTKLANS